MISKKSTIFLALNYGIADNKIILWPFTLYYDQQLNERKIYKSFRKVKFLKHVKIYFMSTADVLPSKLY